MRANKSLIEIIKNVTKPNILLYEMQKIKNKKHSLELERINTIEFGTDRASSTTEISERTSFFVRADRWCTNWPGPTVLFGMFKKYSQIKRFHSTRATTTSAELTNIVTSRLHFFFFFRCCHLFSARWLLLHRLNKHSIFSSFTPCTNILQTHTDSSGDNCFCVYIRHHRYAKHIPAGRDAT